MDILKYRNEHKAFAFYFVDSENKNILYSDWKTGISEVSILRELIDNGFAELRNNEEVLIYNQDISKLDNDDREILGLPKNMSHTFLIKKEGVINTKNFLLKLLVRDNNDNNSRYEIEGKVIKIEGKEFLLSENQYKVYQIISEFNKLSEEERLERDHYRIIMDLKCLQEEDENIKFDDSLREIEVVIPNKMKVDIEGDGAISVEVDGVEGDELSEKIKKGRTLQDWYRVNQTRVLIKSEKYLKTLAEKKEKGLISEEEYQKEVEKEERRKEQFEIIKDTKITEDNVHDVIKNIHLYFDEDMMDFPSDEYDSFLEYFSKRVKEIGIYKPKFYPFISPYKSEWIAGISVEDPINGDVKITIKTKEELQDFQKQINKAKEEKAPNVKYQKDDKEVEIPIDTAEEIKKVAEKQLKSPTKPIVSQSNGKVLIIEDNIEKLGIDEHKALVDLEHKFYPIDNLKEGISLKTHQEEGVAWLQSLYSNNYSGGLLADDMGLGKTLQLLYFIEWHSQNKNSENKPYLIVAPISLLQNWENEYKKFFSSPSLDIFKLYGQGNPLTKKIKDLEINRKEAERLQKKQIILTNYETIRNYQFTLGMIDFAVIALDEAQKIKTPTTYVTNAVKAMKADFKIAMTGTPVENTLVDMWCIMDFAVPGLLGNTKDFAIKYQNPLKDEHLDIEEHTEKLRNEIGDYFKRRLKIDVAKDLPIKHDNESSIIKKEMPTEQLERYKKAINKEFYTGPQILETIQAIRAISDHPYLLIKNKIAETSCEELLKTSAKLQVLINILDNIKLKEEKVILFAERKEIQRMLQRICWKYYQVDARIINGDTSAVSYSQKVDESRQGIIDAFHKVDGFNIIIMSPIAAGVGLNVVGANHIVHYSRHWNPAKEEQATDRAYRIGQEKEVYVYYPMAVFPASEEIAGQSFDEVLNELLSRKKALATNALFPTEQTEVKNADVIEGLGFNITNVSA